MSVCEYGSGMSLSARTACLGVVVALVIANAASAFTAAPGPLCEVVKASAPNGTVVRVTVTRLDGTGCRTARKAMLFCIRHRHVKGWMASRKASALINTSGTKAIYFAAKPAPPTCWRRDARR